MCLESYCDNPRYFHFGHIFEASEYSFEISFQLTHDRGMLWYAYSSINQTNMILFLSLISSELLLCQNNLFTSVWLEAALQHLR